LHIPTDADLYALATRVGARLRAASVRIVTVESCTGGWVAKALTDVAGSSDWVEAGLVTYSNDAKTRLAGVDPATLERHGAVSEATVREMAAGALARFDVQCAVAVSGIAGPAGGTAEKPVGTVWFAWAWRDRGGLRGGRVLRLALHGDREAIRRLSVAAALEGLLADG
jgi:nicotinamide-nucleotide amidase